MSSELSQFVGEDSRTPIERLRRVELWRIADRLEMKYPAGASKDVMIALFTAHDIDVTKEPDITWMQVPGTKADGTPNVEIYPVREPHASARNGVNASAVLHERLEQQAEERRKREAEEAAKKGDEFVNAQLDALRRENEKLRQTNDQLQQTLEQRLAALEAGNSTLVPKKESPQTKYWAMYRKARDLGLKPDRGIKLPQLEAMIARAEQG